MTFVLSALNFVALLAHQYEEYEDPGYFPGQFNRGVLNSDNPRNYPLNAILARKPMWLGLAPVIMGWAQVVVHGVVVPLRLRARAKYGPGALTAVLLHVPVGIAYVKALKQQGPITRRDWAQAAGYGVAFAGFGIALPTGVLRDADSPYPFTEAQMGPYNTGLSTRPTLTN